MEHELRTQLDVVRGFNRYYTNVLGLLNQHILDSSSSLSEARILLEIGKNENCTARKLADTLQMDQGYLSRILKMQEQQGILEKRPCKTDKRAQILVLTEAGQNKLEDLNRRSDEQIVKMIEKVSEHGRRSMMQNMTAIETSLSKEKNIQKSDLIIRSELKPGDAGYLIHLHGWIYKMEYDYSEIFEAYVAQSFYDYITHYDASREKVWIVEHKGNIAGCIGIAAHGDKAQLRWFLLHPDYRGIGLGRQLLDSAIAFAKEKKYKQIYLDTTTDLKDAIRMYTRSGFQKAEEKANDAWRPGVMELRMTMDL